ncbi:MAG TPA: cyclic pyranopterin monophosphate synthase MoaC [Planctomycetota bacterium]|nr:cyclic pyranopterin monophosphate synthase MoaC [Planctomycetota bacterium]
MTVELTHTTETGRARMVNVAQKPVQRRMARAAGVIVMSRETLDLIRDNQIKKGDVLTVAQVAGIQAAKRASDMIPLCHPLELDFVDVQLRPAEAAELPSPAAAGIVAQTEVQCTGRTGAEMEALVAASAALLTVYDMCKAVDDSMRITDVHLIEKVKGNVEEP